MLTVTILPYLAGAEMGSGPLAPSNVCNATIRSMRYLLAFSVIVFTGCRSAAPPPPRVLHVRAAADPTFRERSNWRDLIASRIQTVSKMYELDFEIRLELAAASEWTPEWPTAEDRRRGLLGAQSDGNWLFLGYTGADPTTPEPGVVVPFDNRVLIFDDRSKSETENAGNMAHVLGHVFGAWHSRDEKSVMHLPPGPQFDTSSLSCIRAARAFDTRSGARGMSTETQTQLINLWTASQSEPASNPVFQYFVAGGYELMSTGLLQQAVEPLSRAINLAPSEPRPHYALATAYMLMRRYHAAATEFRKLTELEPNSAGALNNLARALLETGQPEGAVASLRQASLLVPENASLHANMGMALARITGHLDEGIEELRLAQRLSPADPNVKAALDAALAAKASGRR